MIESVPARAPVVPQVLFKGMYEFGYDQKRRVQVPHKWRPPQKEPTQKDPTQEDYAFAVYFSMEEHQQLPCLTVTTQERFMTMVERLNQLKMFDPRVEAFKRDLGSNSDDAVLDKAGRICVADILAEKAGLVGLEKVLLVGVVDRFQIWRPDYYEKVRLTDRTAASELKREI